MDDHIILTVDCVVFDKENKLLLIKRGIEPFKGQYALPGGRVEYGESTEEAAMRELEEETDVRVESLKLIGVYSKPGRDPRGHTVSVAYLSELPNDAELKAGDDAAEVELVSDWENKDLAFDHNEILSDALKKL